MKNILFITISFPPYGGIASIRIGCFVKYLEQRGYNCIVFCPDKKYGYYDETSVTNLNTKAFYGYVKNRNTKFYDYFNRKFALDYTIYGYFPLKILNHSKKVLRSLIKTHSIDIVFASFPQFINLYLASWIKDTYHIPWIADFRDVIEEFNYGLLSTMCFRKERKIVHTAAIITTVSNGLKRYLSKRHLQNICVIPNGFDPDDYLDTSYIHFDKFTISYTGNITGNRNPLLLLLAIDELILDNLIDVNSIEINFYGAAHHVLFRHIKFIKNKDVINCFPNIDKKSIINIQISSHLLLLLANADWKIDGILTGKLYEYLAANRPIIAIPKYRSIDDILISTGHGHSFDDKEAIKSYIFTKYSEWLNGEYVGLPITHDHLQKYSRAFHSKQLASIIDNVLA